MSETQADARPTCGMGLAANSVLPATLGELLDAQAEVLERHLSAIDGGDPTAGAEIAAYSRLAGEFRRIAGELRVQAEDMAACRGLAMPRHDVAVLSAPDGQLAAFRRFVGLEQELKALLEAKIDAERRMLG